MAPFDEVLAALRAIGESTRLRIVAVLQHGELSVTELTDILGQSQPRISRHLKVLTDAAVIERHREGNRVFFSLRGDGAVADTIRAVLRAVDPDDAGLANDEIRLAEVRDARARAADAYFAAVAQEWDELRSRHAPEAEVEAAVRELTEDLDYSSVIDLGTGTGRMLQVLAGGRQLDRVVGVDSSPAMLAVARARLDDRGGIPTGADAGGTAAVLTNVELRHGDLHATAADSFDLVMVHQVLHFLDDPDRAIRHAASLVAPGGHLVVVDMAPHNLEFLQTDHAHRRLGFDVELVDRWMTNAGLDQIATAEIAPGEIDDGLTVVVWRGHRPHPTDHQPDHLTPNPTQ